MLLRSKYLLINPETLVENGFVCVSGDRIKSSGKFSEHECRGEKAIDLGETVIMPGLVNPHAHLEGPETFGGTPPPGEKRLLPFQSFTEWAEQIINMRQRMKPDIFIKTTDHGYDLLAINGITFVGDHSHIARTKNIHANAKIRRVVFEEVTDLNPLTAQQRFDEVRRNVKLIKKDKFLGTGVAPHAPYTVSSELYKKLYGFARQQNIPLSTHLSELKEERELLTKGKGKIRAYLKRVGRDNYYWRHPGTTSVQYMAKLGVLRPPSFFVHCNYLSNKDITVLAKSGVSVVFCPSSHYFFGHRNHPFRKLLKLKVNVALGTDGLGSNEDLSILKEMKFILDHYPGVNPTQLLRMGTLNGLKTLKATEKLGELKPGYCADIAAFPLKHKSTKPEHLKRVLIETSPKSILTMVAGKIIHRG